MRPSPGSEGRGYVLTYKRPRVRETIGVQLPLEKLCVHTIKIYIAMGSVSIGQRVLCGHQATPVPTRRWRHRSATAWLRRSPPAGRHPASVADRAAWPPCPAPSLRRGPTSWVSQPSLHSSSSRRQAQPDSDSDAPASAGGGADPASAAAAAAESQAPEGVPGDCGPGEAAAADAGTAASAADGGGARAPSSGSYPDADELDLLDGNQLHTALTAAVATEDYARCAHRALGPPHLAQGPKFKSGRSSTPDAALV